MRTATHNGKFTFSSPTGEHRTFQIKTQKEDSNFMPGERIVSLLIGRDNQSDYQSFGVFGRDGKIHVWKKFNGTVFEKYAKMLTDETLVQKWGMTVQESVRCRRCNRELTDEISITTGIGPVCRGEE